MITTAYPQASIVDVRESIISTEGPVYLRESSPVPMPTNPSVTIEWKSIQFTLPTGLAETGQMAPSLFTSLCADEALGHVWNNPAEDDAWRDL